MVLPRLSGPTVSRHSARPTIHTNADDAPCATRAIVKTATLFIVKSRAVATNRAARPHRKGSCLELVLSAM